MIDPATTPEIVDAPAQHAQAAPATLRTRRCAWCDEPFVVPVGPGGHKRFCSPKHRDAFGNREKAQGAVLVSIAKVWRRKRGSGPLGKQCFAEMCTILDLLNDRDRTKKLPQLDDYVASVMQTAAIDRLDDSRVRRKRVEAFRVTMAAR